MMLAFKTKKSAGIRVEPRVHRLLQQGDAARDAARWADAVAHYRAALDRAPGLPHIQLQLGHAFKELGQLDQADAAYAAAARLRPNDLEALLHRAHLAKRIDPSAAVAHFASILLRESGHHEALKELNSLLGPVGSISADQLRVLADYDSPEVAPFQSARASPAETPEQTDPSAPRPLVFDLTDLVGHFRNERLPNGIQRVQTEVLAALLDRRGDDEIALCCFVSGRDDWMEVPLTLCRDLIRLAGMSSDASEPEWQAARIRLFRHLALADHYVLPWRAVLVNLGVSFWVYDYYRFIRNAKAERQISYIPLVYDMIPLVKPELCVRGWIQDFTIWAVGLFQHADGFLAISQSAKRDLLEVADRLGHSVPEDHVEVVPLDADFRRAGATLPASALDQWDLSDTPFALMVATIEPRKNHGLAFDAWAELLRRHGAAAVPKLVCAGRDGWMNDDVFDRLDTDPALAAHVIMIPRASDTELALLYRESRFTVFPSLYEGWGLPVTESLCHGRVPVIADNSSLPEAGAGFARLFASGSVSGLVSAVEQVAFDDVWRAAQEARIAAGFTPRSWAQIADQIESAQTRLLDEARPPALPPFARPGLYYPLGLYRGPGIWRGLASGEIYRIGDGWTWPDDGGCRTTPEGGMLQMRVAGHDGQALRLYLRLRGLTAADCPAIATVDGTKVGTITVRRQKYGWMVCDLPPDGRSAFDILVRGSVSEVAALADGGFEKRRPVSISVAGFFLCGRDDEAANRAFIQTRRGNLEAINAYRRSTDTTAFFPDKGPLG